MRQELFNQDPDKEISHKRVKELINENDILKSELARLKKDLDDIEFLRPDKTFGVAVSGDVLADKLEVKIINTPTFQRLRKIKQLGSTNLVFPSAHHNRFEHSLGVLKSADLIIRSIRNNQHSTEPEKYISAEEEQIIRLLALLHDIGHMPYGHTIEDEFGIFLSHDKHETRWDYIIGRNSDIGKLIIDSRGEPFFNRFFNLIKCEKNFKGLEQDAFMYDIISNTVCADLLDYLERDCFYTNLQLRYHPRFINYFFIKEIKKPKIDVKIQKGTEEFITEKRLAIRVYKKGKKELRRDILSELIQLLRNRYYLGERVYYHHAKIKTGTLLAGAVSRAKYANAFKEIDFKDMELIERIKRNSDKPEEKILYSIHAMGDEELINFLKNLKIPETKDSNQEIQNKITKLKGAKRLAELFDRRTKYSEIIYRTKNDLGIEDEYDTEIYNIDEIDKPKIPKHYIAGVLYNRFIKPGSATERLTIEDTICNYLKMDSGDLLIYCPNFSMAMKLAKAYVEDARKEIYELKDFNDDSTRYECDSIIEKHQALWALRVFINSKYVNESHPEYLPEYEDYKDLILKYCNWTILPLSEEQEKEFGIIFWNAYIDYILLINENKGNPLGNTKVAEKRVKMKELTSEFLSQTLGDRSYETIVETIENKFKTSSSIER